MDDNFGRAAIIENGSPLVLRWNCFRRKSDPPLDVGERSDRGNHRTALPDLFYNTGIATYIWVLSKNKRRERKGKIQLIDASGFYGKLRKALGNKKNEISSENRTQITKLYADFAENEYCKIYKNEEFIYREYTVMQPLQRAMPLQKIELKQCCQKALFLPFTTRRRWMTGEYGRAVRQGFKEVGGLSE